MRPGDSSAHGWHQGARGATLPEQLERLALMGMTRNEQLSTGWVDESHQGGMLLAVLGHLGEPTAASWPGWPPPAPRRTPWCWTSRPGTAPARREPPATAALRGGGWKATTLERDGSLAAAWLELAR